MNGRFDDEAVGEAECIYVCVCVCELPPGMPVDDKTIFFVTRKIWLTAVDGNRIRIRCETLIEQLVLDSALSPWNNP